MDNRALNLRSATQADEQSIRQMVHAEQLNPMALDWEHFVLLETPAGETAGIGQVKRHWDGTQELASLVVVEAWREQGLARRIITHLLETHPGVMYLTCRSGLEPFYKKFGFRSVRFGELPPYFRLLWLLAQPLLRLARRTEGLSVMARAG